MRWRSGAQVCLRHNNVHTYHAPWTTGRTEISVVNDPTKGIATGRIGVRPPGIVWPNLPDC